MAATMRNTRTLTLILLVLANSVALTAVALAHEGEDHHDSAYDTAMESYLSIQTALAGDTIKGVADHANTIAKSTKELTADAKADKNTAAAKLLPGIKSASEALAKAKDIEAARAAFGDLSAGMVGYRKLVGGDGPKVAYCPMADKSWLQNGKKITNPYFGSKMLRCGKFVEK